MKISITVAEKTGGKLEVLYVGADSNKAVEVANAAKGYIRVCVFRKPTPYKRILPGSAVIHRKVVLAKTTPATSVSALTQTPVAPKAPATPATPTPAAKIETADSSVDEKFLE